MKAIVLFDGDCTFCNKSVQFIIKRDPECHFLFTSLQSTSGMQIRHQYDIPDGIDSIVLIENNSYYTASTAALRIARKLTKPWKFIYLFLLVPEPIRDVIYHLIAKHRRKLFNSNPHCTLPSVEEKRRFLSL